MTKFGKIVVTLLVLALLAGVGLFLFKKGIPVSVTTVPEPVVTTGLKVSPLVTNDTTTAYTEMHVVYPHSSTTEYPEIFNLVNGTRNDFINKYGRVTDTEARNMYMSSTSPYQLFITTRIATSTKTVSYILEVYQFTGGAHGGMSVSTFTYDADHKLVTIDKVFKPDYLKTIADMSHTFFTSRADEGFTNKTMIKEGTTATTTNFGAWYLTDTTVTFIFQQYQIGPYVLGIQEYPILKSEIQGMLQAEFK